MHQGDVALDARQRARRRAGLPAGAAGRSEGRRGRGPGSSRRRPSRADASTRKGDFDDALATVDDGLAVDPQSVRLAALKRRSSRRSSSARSSSRTIRPIAPPVSRFSARTSNSTRRTRCCFASLKRFGYTFDANDLTTAIKRSYELQLDVAKNTNRLILYRQLVTSGVPESAVGVDDLRRRSLLPLP